MCRNQNYEFCSDRADLRLMGPCYLLGILFLALFFPFKLGVNVPIFVTCVYIVAFGYQKLTDAPVDRGSTTLFLIVMIASLPFVLYDESPFRVLHFLILMGAVLFQCYTMFSCRAFPRLSECWLYDLANAVVFTPLFNLDAFWRVLARRFAQSRFRTVLLILSGIAVALPLMLLLGTQLSSADAVFEFLRSRFSTPFWRYGGKIALGMVAAVPIGVFLYAAFFGFRHRRCTEVATKPDADRVHIVPSEAVIAGLIPVCALQILYLVSQVGYFFSTFSGFLPENYTYAQYARRGFLELCLVSLVNLTLIAAALSFTKYKKRVTEKIVNALVLILCICSLGMILTAFAKMILYMHSFGLTANRIITSWFMLGLALVFIFTIIRCFHTSFKLIRATTVTAIAMFLMLCFVDCDNLAVSYNKEAYLSGRLEGFDVEMLYRASDSVIPLVIDLYEHAEGDLKEDARALLQSYAEHYDGSIATWRSFNIARYDAHTKFLRWQENSGFELTS